MIQTNVAFKKRQLEAQTEYCFYTSYFGKPRKYLYTTYDNKLLIFCRNIWFVEDWSYRGL